MKKEMGKFLALILTGVFLFSMLTAIVSAETNFEVWGKTAAGGIADFLDTLKINPTALSSILLGILLWIVIFSVVKQIFNYDGKTGWIASTFVSLIVVILTFIYMPENFIEAIALQYSAVGATILTVIPLAILLYFTVMVTDNKFFAKVIWIFYVVYYFTLFVYKITAAPAGTAILSADNIPYLGAIIAGVLIIFFLGEVREQVFKAKLSAAEEKALRGVRVRGKSRKVLDEEAKGLGISPK